MRSLLRVLLAVVAWAGLGAVAAADGARQPASAGTSEVDDCRHAGGDATGAETRAYEHYERGRNLYEQGDYRAAIDEFALAYCHTPSATVLRDVAQAFERLVDYEKAVAYLDRYILESSDSEHEERRVQAARAQVLRNLPARVRIATEPPGASVTLTSTAGTRSAHGFSNAEEPLEIRKGRYVMTVELPGHERITETIEVAIGQPYSYYYRLEPRKGMLRVVTVPADADIFVDNRRVGAGNYVDRLPIGKYAISAEADDHVSETREVSITDGDQANVPLHLRPVPRSARRELLLAASLGGAVAGPGVATLFTGDEAILSGAGLLGLGLGLGGAYLGVPDDIPVGTSSYIIGATLIGALEAGALARYYLGCPIVSDGDGGHERLDCGETRTIAASLGGGVAGFLFSALTVSRFNLDAGDAALINSGALWGVVGGALFWLAFDQDARIQEPLILGGLNIGVLTGALLAQRYSVSRGHVGLIDVSGFLGLLVGAAVANALPEDAGVERLPHLSLLGLSVGLITGIYLTRDMDEPAILGVSPTVGAAMDSAGKSIMTLGATVPF